jgi:hypothetical protein
MVMKDGRPDVEIAAYAAAMQSPPKPDNRNRTQKVPEPQKIARRSGYDGSIRDTDEASKWIVPGRSGGESVAAFGRWDR